MTSTWRFLISILCNTGAAPKKNLLLFFINLSVMAAFSVFTAQISYAQQTSPVAKLEFTQKLSPSLGNDISTYLNAQSMNSQDYAFALYDLNGDNLDEIFIKEKDCATSDVCSYTILAYTKNTLSQIAQIKCKILMIGGSTSYGIIDLLAFNDDINDYNFNIYMWSPKQKTYILNKE